MVPANNMRSGTVAHTGTEYLLSGASIISNTATSAYAAARYSTAHGVITQCGRKQVFFRSQRQIIIETGN